MKVICLLVILTSFVALGAVEFQDSFFLGVTQSKLSGDFPDEVDGIRFGILNGVQFGYTLLGQFENNFSLGLITRYIEKGWMTEDDSDLYTVKNNYFELALRAGYIMPKLNYIGLHPYSGLGMGFFLNSEQPVKAHQNQHMSFIVGIDVNLWEKFVIDFNYNIGLTDIYDGIDAKYNVFGVSLGKKF
ncbi:MAG: PorT family protein [Candidatus Cloacimonetes bacterium]|nr:PorT family protein [Candidatus Cloacimonadota bacterium]